MPVDPFEIRRLHDEEGMTFRDIGNLLDIPKSTAYDQYKASVGKDNPETTQPDGTKFTKQEDGNNLTIAVETAADIKSLDELLTYCQVDLSVWTVTRHIVNKWATPRKETYKDLEWIDGRVTGTVRDTGQMTQTGLIQVKAWLARKEPVPLSPTITPISPSVPLKWAVTKPIPASGRSLISSDWHIGYRRDLASGHLSPFHDRQAIATFIDLAAATQPDRIDLLGDMIDLPEWSDKFVRSTDMQQTTQPALQELYFWLLKLRSVVPNVPIFVYEGNHSYRLRRAMMVHLPQACNLTSVTNLKLPPALSLQNLLGLDALGIKWIGDYPNGCSYLGSIRLEHGDVSRKGPGDTVKAVIEASNEPVIFGHNHRLEKSHRSLYVGGKYAGVIFAASAGCLCSLEPATVPGHTVKQNWQNGAIVADFEKSTAAMDPHLVLINRGTAMWERFAIRGEPKPCLEELRDSFKPWAY